MDYYSMLKEENLEESLDEELSEGEKFEAWKRRAEAIIELREAQQDMRNEESKQWEDWIVDGEGGGENRVNDWDSRIGDETEDPFQMNRGLVETATDFFAGEEDEDMLYEDRVFQYAYANTAKFMAVLIIIPWALDFVVHDYVLMPFLDRYVKTVPLAAELFDVNRSEKIEMARTIKLEKSRYMFEVEIGKAPPISDEELWRELRHKALELREEFRLENRSEFANIWSDAVFGVSLYLILYFNPSKLALLKFTGYKLFNNISDAGKAFIIIAISDTILGYHSQVGWVALVETILDHYGFPINDAGITFFVSTFPVLFVLYLKLWLYFNLRRLAPGVESIYEKMG